jgi:hypothetical protein
MDLQGGGEIQALYTELADTFRSSKVPDWLTTPARMAPSFTQSPRSPPVRRFKGTTSPRRRGQGMTPHEGAVFNEVLDAIWRDLEASGVSKDRERVSPYGPMMSGKVRERQVVGVGAGLDASQKDLLQEMDRLKEEMSSLQTDVDLLDWAKRRVFTPQPSQTSTDESGAKVEATATDEVVNYPATYPHVLAHLLQVSRNTFQNPHMALSLFHHARTLSLDSYLQGCLTPAYNEALTTRWESFRDIDGVEQGIREMELHGVGWDRGTCNLISQIVEQVSKDVLSRAGHWSDATISRMRKLEESVERDVKRQERHWAMSQQQDRRAR